MDCSEIIHGKSRFLMEKEVRLLLGSAAGFKNEFFGNRNVKLKSFYRFIILLLIGFLYLTEISRHNQEKTRKSAWNPHFPPLTLFYHVKSRLYSLNIFLMKIQSLIRF